MGLYNDQAIAELHSCSLGGLGCAPGPLEKSIPVGRQSTGQTRTLAVLSKTYDLCCGFDKTLWLCLSQLCSVTVVAHGEVRYVRTEAPDRAALRMQISQFTRIEVIEAVGCRLHQVLV